MSVRIGLVSDTHVPDRCAALPEVLFEVLAGVDLVLHAGDVGELWVLDELSRIAPVVAVHGNDDSVDALRVLPYQQMVAAAGQRILVTHAHFPNRMQELESRLSDDWGPVVGRRVALAKDAGAQVIVFGHTHVPMVHHQDNVLLINPGAIGPGNPLSRQRRRSVAVLLITDDGEQVVTHVDLHHPRTTFRPDIDLGAGFRAAMSRYSESILSSALAERVSPWREYLSALPEHDANMAWNAWKQAAHRCWSGEQDVLAPEDVVVHIERSPDLDPELQRTLARVLLQHD